MKKKVDPIPMGGYFQNCQFWSPGFRRPDPSIRSSKKRGPLPRERSLSRLQSGEARRSRETPHFAKLLFRREKGDQNSGQLRLINIAFSGTSFFQYLLWASIGSAVLL
jgi:hypothetical protein